MVLTHAQGDRTGVRWLSNGIKARALPGPSPPPAVHARDAQRGAQVYYVPRRTVYLQITLPTVFGLLRLLRCILLREGITLVHAHQAFSPMAHEAILHARTLGCKVVFTDHSLFGFADVASILTNKVLKFTAASVHQVRRQLLLRGAPARAGAWACHCAWCALSSSCGACCAGHLRVPLQQGEHGAASLHLPWKGLNHPQCGGRCALHTRPQQARTRQARCLHLARARLPQAQPRFTAMYRVSAGIMHTMQSHCLRYSCGMQDHRGGAVAACVPQGHRSAGPRHPRRLPPGAQSRLHHWCATATVADPRLHQGQGLPGAVQMELLHARRPCSPSQPPWRGVQAWVRRKPGCGAGGEGPKAAVLQHMVAAQGLQGRVRLEGPVSHAAVRALLVRGDLFLNASLTEAFCMAIVEAAAAGLLVVSTDVGGVPEVRITPCVAGA